MSDTGRPLSPHLQVYRWQITMTLSILHRATGVALSVAALCLAGWLIAAAAGPEAYLPVRDFLATPPGLVAVAGATFCLFYHLCNGVRHLVWDTGEGFEIAQFYATGWAVVILSLLLSILVLLIGYGVIGGEA